MKKTLTFLFVIISCFSYSQTFYKKKSKKDINQERLNIAKSFAQEYLQKCENKDYTKFKDFIIDSKLTKKLNDSIKENCEKMISDYGNTEVLNLNSVYYHKYAKDYDPIDLFIFDFKTEKKPEIKYASVWIYEDKSVIGGLWFSNEKPLTFKQKK
ncbi:hypothetical protein JSO54_02775 [Riemerella anatipestifer]|uniref:hypothetical protein n=1 Tax=Riemerella anatipestifer TaxID=34085 RepID=UPI0030C64677